MKPRFGLSHRSDSWNQQLDGKMDRAAILVGFSINTHDVHTTDPPMYTDVKIWYTQWREKRSFK